MRKDIVIILFCFIYLLLYHTSPLVIYEPLTGKIVFYKSTETIKMFWYGYFFISTAVAAIGLLTTLRITKSYFIIEILSFLAVIIFLFLIVIHEYKKWLS